MESVYGGALVSLAASSATSVAQVFFLKPDDYIGGFCARVTTHTWCRIYRYSHADDYEKSSRVARQANRAWAFQEKLLLTGIIYFSDGGIFWGCRPMIASEFVPDRLQHQSLVNLSRPEDKSYPWRDVVLEYFTALLTYGSDRLPALAAIAARRHEVTDDQYLAGLWRDRLLSIPAALVLQSSGQARVIAVAGADLVLEGY
uniref:Heterokaryon incompatibility domain-containing protein n=1 Tax=Bionectria ochroleuca TaxID=29856 RepID=A0A8H7N3L6_BIOOC